MCRNSVATVHVLAPYAILLYEAVPAGPSLAENVTPLLPRGGEGESFARSPPFPRGYIWFFGLLGGGPPLYRLFVLSERACVFTFFGATTSQRPSYLIKTPHHHHHNTTEEEDRADNTTPSPPPLAALFVVGGGGGGRRREEKKKRKNILYARTARNAFFCMM